MTHLILRPEAAAEVEDAFDWYEEKEPGYGSEFLTEIRNTVSRILENPMQFPQVHGDTRKALLRRFPYALMFRLQDEAIVVTACFHMHRNPMDLRHRR